MKFLSHFASEKELSNKFVYVNGTLAYIHKLVIGEDAEDGIYLADGTQIIDKDGNITITDITLDDLTASGDIVLGDASGDTLTVGATSTFNAPITVGLNDTGHDVKFFGATAGAYMLWDESADDLILAGAAGLSVAGATILTGTLTVGVDDVGLDVKFFGATAGSYLLWDESADALIINAGSVDCGNSCEADAYTVGGTAGIDFNAAVTNITVVKGIVTAAS